MIYAVGIILIILIVYIFIIYNTFVKADNKVKEAFSTMDVYMKKRWDLIPNLVETVKGYADYEKKTLEEITNLRNLSYNSMGVKEKLQTGEKVNEVISKLMLLSESYPELKASENFIKLSSELTQIENDIANSRKYYNGTVRQFNNTIETVPNNIFAKLFGYNSKKWFEANENERQNIKVEL